MQNRAIINGPASVERNAARLGRLRIALQKVGISADRKASLEAEVARLTTELAAQRDAITAALEGSAKG